MILTARAPVIVADKLYFYYGGCDGLHDDKRVNAAIGLVGRVAIFKDNIPPDGAPASPDYLAHLLDGPAFSTAFLDSEQLADPRALSREQFDVLVLPYGASFPERAADNFRKFLRDGGKFLSTGGRDDRPCSLAVTQSAPPRRR